MHIVCFGSFISHQVPWEKSVYVPPAATCAAEWMAKRSAAQCAEYRAKTLGHIRELAQAFRSSGKCEAWFSECDAKVRAVAELVNGPLMPALAESTGYGDCACVEFFRAGALLLGELPRSGIGTPCALEAPCSVDELWAQRVEWNQELMASRREDANSRQLLQVSMADADLKRMSKPMRLPVGSKGPHNMLLSPGWVVLVVVFECVFAVLIPAQVWRGKRNQRGR